MGVLYDWIKNIAFYLIFMTVVMDLLAASSYEKYLRFFAGAVLILVVFQPLTGALRLDEHLVQVFASFSAEAEDEEFERRLQALEEERSGRILEQYRQTTEETLRQLVQAEGYGCLKASAELETDPDSPFLGQVRSVHLEITGGAAREKKAGIQVEPVRLNQQIVQPPSQEELGELAGKVAAYYGLEETRVTLEWKADQGKMAVSSVYRRDSDDFILSHRRKEIPESGDRTQWL